MSGHKDSNTGPLKSATDIPFLTLVREMAKLFAGFAAPDDFVPLAPRPPRAVPPEMLRHLGAPSLADFYALALDNFPEKHPAPLPLFPEGPESLRPALTALEREIARLKLKNTKRLATYEESRADLLKVARLWPKVKKEALKWPEEAAKLWQMAGRLENGISRLLKSFQATGAADEPEEISGGGRRRASLTRAAADLKKAVEGSTALIAEKQHLSRHIESMAADLEGLLAAAADSLDGNRDWAEVKLAAERRLSALEKEAARLKSLTEESREKLAKALETLDNIEEGSAGQRAARAGKERLEAALRGIQALLASVLDRRRALAKMYFALPQSIGRPAFLEKTHLVTAVSLGRTQSLLEEMRHRLSLAMGRLSSTHALRREAEETAGKFLNLPDHEAFLQQGQRRLAALSRVIDQRLSFKRVLNQNAESESELSRTRLDNERLTRHLKSAAIESERLGEQLTAAKKALGEMGRFKAKLLKSYAQKTALLQAVEKARQDFATENAALKAAKAELKRKRARLASIYKLEHGDVKRLNREIDEHKDELAINRELLTTREDERSELARHLEGTRRERDTLAAHQRDLEERAGVLEEQAADAATRATALSAEMYRLSEELTKVSRARENLRERLSAARRKLDLLARAQTALRSHIQRQNARLEAAETEREHYRAKLTRQNENILRLVTVRQELRAELGRSTLRLSDLEKEKNDLFTQLNAHRQRADEAEKAGALLESRVGGLESENSRLISRVSELSGEVVNLTETRLDLSARLATAEERKAELSRQLAELEGRLENDFAPLVKILGEALYHSEAAHRQSRRESAKLLQNFKSESGLMMERLRLSADVREANIRLKAAARELDITDAAKKESQELNASMAHLTARHSKLRQALDTLKQRYAGNLDEARATEIGLRDLIDTQNRELKRQKHRLGELEPFVTHFLEQAELGRLAPDAPELALIRHMKSEAGDLGPAEATESPFSASLLARLAELQPLVAFLAKNFVTGVAELAQAREERARLAEQLQETAASRNVLEASLDSRQSELSEVRDQAFALTRERDQLHEILTQKDSDIRLLKTELAEADRDLAENDGRLEAAWAGLNYLGAKAGDNLARMKARLENQTRQSDKLSGELKSRNERIRDLEERQDKLALFYWTLVSRLTAAEARPLEFAPALPGPEILEIEAEALPEFLPSAQPEENYDLLDAARKAARHGLFTLLLAGGLLMGGPALAAEPMAPPLGENPRLAAGLESSFVGRPVSLDFVESKVRIQGPAAVETRVKERVNEVAQGHSLSSQEFLKLLRQARAPEALLHLGDFEGRAGVSALLAKHMPKLAPELKGLPEQLRDLLKAAAAFRPEEGAFWERLYFNLNEKLSRADSLEALLRLLDRKLTLAARPQPEFAGRLAPFADVENMASATFIPFMGGHIKTVWPFSGGRGRGGQALAVAGDLYFSARLHKLPPSLLAAIAHWELEEGGAEALLDSRSATLFLYKKADTLADLAIEGGEIWQNGRAPLCDLDEILAAQYGPLGMENIFRKKMKIIMSYNKMISQASNLFV